MSDAAAATWELRGDESRRRRGRYVEIQSRQPRAAGTSLCGMSADSLVSQCANRAKRNPAAVPGSVIVSLQRTPHDSNSSLRIFALLDDVLEGLAKRLGATTRPPPRPRRARGDDVFRVPYDAAGERSKTLRELDLRDGSEIILGFGPDSGMKGVILSKNAECHYRVAVDYARKTPDNEDYVTKKKIHGRVTWREIRLLGSWWVDAALAGDVDRIPVANP